MLRFEMANNRRAVVSIDPDAVAAITETAQTAYPQASLISGPMVPITRFVATIVLMTGEQYTVADPNRIVARQIEGAKKK